MCTVYYVLGYITYMHVQDSAYDVPQYTMYQYIHINVVVIKIEMTMPYDLQ